MSVSLFQFLSSLKFACLSENFSAFHFSFFFVCFKKCLYKSSVYLLSKNLLFFWHFQFFFFLFTSSCLCLWSVCIKVQFLSSLRIPCFIKHFSVFLTSLFLLCFWSVCTTVQFLFCLKIDFSCGCISAFYFYFHLLHFLHSISMIFSGLSVFFLLVSLSL